MLAQPATFHDQRFSKSLSFAQDAPSGHSVDPFMNIHLLRAPLLTLGALWVGLAALSGRRPTSYRSEWRHTSVSGEIPIPG